MKQKGRMRKSRAVLTLSDQSFFPIMSLFAPVCQLNAPLQGRQPEILLTERSVVSPLSDMHGSSAHADHTHP